MMPLARPPTIFFALILALAGLTPAPTTAAAELAEGQKLFRTGEYAQAIDAAAKGIESDPWREGWWVLKIRSELVTGKYAEALQTFEAGQNRHAESIPLRLLGFEALRVNGRQDDAEAALAGIREIAERAPWRYTDATSRVALGRALLQRGGDARQVLELFYDKAKKESPDSAEPYLASGELALEKQDHALAAEAFAEAAKRSPEDPEIYYGLARAFDNDGDRATAALTKAL